MTFLANEIRRLLAEKKISLFVYFMPLKNSFEKIDELFSQRNSKDLIEKKNI